MLATQTAITTTSNTVTDTLSSSNECPTIQQQQQEQQQQQQQPLHLYRNKSGESSSNGSTTNTNNSTHIKLERRDSSTSESSLEHLDLGRTPKKFNKATTSTPFVPNDKSTTTTTKSTITNDSIQPLQTVHLQQRLQESDDGNDYDDEESSDEKHTRNINTSSVIITQNLQQSEPQRLTHYKRRYCGRNLLDKRTSIQLEYNPDNPNSLRKKFRFNRSSSENVTCSNESGFVEGSHSSLLINNTSITNSHSHSHSKSNTSSAASTPPYNQQNGGISSPESGVGEREDMKYVCPICEVVSPTPHEFTNHIRCHNYASGDTENFTCRICSKVLSSASSLDRHVLVHTGERPFNCKYCHLTFTTNGNMHRHMRTHKQHQHTHHRRNSNGTKLISSSNNNNNHNNNKNGAAVVTNAAASIIAATTQNAAGILNNPSTTTLPSYATAASNGPLQEGVKSSAINNYNTGSIDAVDHYSSNALSTGAHGNGQRLNGLTNFESYESDGGCSSDNSTANSQLSQSNNHNNDSNNNNNINNNDIKLNNNNFKRKLLDDRRDFDDRTIELKRCLNSDIINGSVVMPEPPTPNDTCGLVCPACNDNDFSNMLDLDNHMDSKHPDIPAKCKYCEVIFRTHHQLNIHPCTDELTHHLAYVNKMNVTRSLPLGEHCSNDTAFAKDDHTAGESQLMEENENQRKEFFRQFYMNKAITEANTQYQKVHEQSSQPDAAEDDVKSEPSAHDSKDLADIQSILNMTSSSSTSNFLKNFEQNVNTPSSQCSYDKDEEEAQDAFTSEFRKMKLRGEFPCKLCTAVFPNLRALKGHNRVHLSEAGLSGPFRCNMCPYSNCDKAALVRHMRTHNGDRPYECAVCNYAFTTKANCERHLRNRHAKTTREEVKRAIIYHPSEDSSCDDPTKKLHMFSSPECDDDNELIMCHTIQPKDRSTPVSHLKEMLTAGESLSAKPVKIQVKSLEQLLDKSSAYQESYEQEKNNISSNNESNGPIDMSMDALDLSKKSSTNQQKKHADQGNQAAANTFNRPAQEPKPVYAENEPINLENPLYEVSALEKQQQQQLFLAQQQLLTNPTQYLQQLYRNLMLPQLSPFFLPNSFMPNSNLAELQKFAPFLSRMFGTPTAITAPSTAALSEDIEKASLANSSNAMNSLLPQISPLMCSEKCSPNSLNSLPSPKDMQAPNPATLNIPLQSLPLPLQLPPPPPPPPHLTSTMLSNAPVKMVLKNGVFMPKQKQRRYRTERPFACEHCSARFTLRSNMERHVKQQHPQYYAQRQRTGHNVMRGRGASNAGNLNSITHLQAAFAHNSSPAGLSSSSPISDQVKYAILAQQLKARKETDLLHQALSHGSGNVNSNHMFHISPSNGPNGLNFINSNTSNTPNGSMEDDEDKLIIDEDGEDIIDDVPDKNDGTENRDENPSEGNITLEINEESYGKTKDSENHAENVTKSILEQAIKAGHGHGCVSKAELKSVPAPNTMNSMIAQAPAVGKFLKEVASSPFKDESQDLVSVSKLVDNATSNSVSFNNYFRPSDLTNQMEHSDEEGLVASGSASESNNSGAEDTAVVAVQPKKKSAYSLAPNRVSCPYCQRMFPWSSSLRRHILTHTGQKPFKCSHCPLLFTTKSNCDRHLLRKHGNIESATSVYVPTEDVTEPIPPPKSVEEIEKMQRQRDEEERKRKADKVREREERERLEKEQQREKQQTQEQEQQQQQQQQHDFFKQLAAAQMQHYSHKSETSQVSSADLPFKCHLCENSFTERLQCLEHIKCMHAQDFALLLSKGAIDSDAETSQLTSNEEEERNGRGHEDGLKLGKYPDYSNRKVICAFCMRRFWSTEDLRRHMRTHSGERPFQCEICLRKFTLKHSMLRHMKKHNGLSASDDCQAGGDFSTNANSGSDYSDDEQTPTIQPNIPTAANNSLMLTPNMNASFIGKKIQELLNKANEWRSSNLNGLDEHKRNITEESNNMQHTDLIGNLLGINDQNMLNKLMSSPDEAAKLLGVDK